MRTLWTVVWHFLAVLLLLAIVAASIGLSNGADFYYGESDVAYSGDGEGPHVFRHGDRWLVETVRGSADAGFAVDRQSFALDQPLQLEVDVPLDHSRFSVQAVPRFAPPPTRYRDGEPILAISDIEGNFCAFRDFLLHAGVIDVDLEWTFGRGHLVLVGDFVDRGASVTQVLWLIYKLQRDAARAGGHVHYILGNHEIKNLQGDFHSAHDRYFAAATILGRGQWQLFGEASFLGRWLASRNTIEVINDTLFVHGGLHPDLAFKDWSLDDVNRIVREHYRTPWYPKRDAGAEDFLLDPATGPSWYRGYFKGHLDRAQVQASLARFGASTVVVGHTLNRQVRPLFDGVVYAIDVKHPSDYRSTLPSHSSEGLWLEAGKAWRVLADGSRVAL